LARQAHFSVFGTFDKASRPSKGKMTIDRGAGLVMVRRNRARRTYSLPIDMVANWVVQRVIKGEVFKKRMERSKKGK
jgi:hypothetical protein